MTTEERITHWTAESEKLQAQLSDLQAKYDAERPNREAGNGAEASRLYAAMLPIKRKLEDANKEVASAKNWLKTFAR